jgi:hypothetical protein
MTSPTLGTRTRFTALLIALTLLAGCGDPVTAPTSPGARDAAVKFWEVGASVAWNRTAQGLLVTRPASPIAQARLFAYLSVAQYNAIVAAEDANDRGEHASVAAAAGAASLVVLRSFFPLDHPRLDDSLAAQRSAQTWPGARNRDFAAGEAIGRAIGAAVVQYAAADRAGLMAAPPNPGGAGNWTGVNSITGLIGVRTFAMTSDDQFRPGPPPAYGSAEFNAALDEIEALTAAPSPTQLAIARAWATRGPAYLNGIADSLIIAHHSTEREAARVLALANMALFDVSDACFDAKLAYYLIRPSQVPGSTVTLWLGLPNHPAYPSGHSCQTSALATVMMAAFPDAREYLESQVEEAGLSRMYAGLHYRFDCTVGQQLGRDVAEWVMKTAPVGHAAIPLD